MKTHLGSLFFLTFLLFLGGCKTDQKKTNSTQADMTLQETSKSNNVELLVGTYTNTGSEGIYALDFDPMTGALSNKKLLVAHENPGFLYISKDRSKVYSANSGKPGSVSAYEFTDDRNKLNLIGDYSNEGAGPCHIELNRSENLLAAANYGSGSIVAYPLDAEGNVIDKPQSFQHEGSGPHPNQKSAHAHCVKFDATGKFLYAVDLGIDEVVAYEITAEGILGKSHTALKMDPGDGPRHMIFHSEKDMVFIINELSSSVTTAKVDTEKGTFSRIDKQSTLPTDFEGNNSCADIHLSPDGKFLYGSNRGHNSITIFSVSEEGKLQLLSNESVLGDWPRNFTLSPEGNFLLVANRKTDNIVVFKRDSGTGMLSYTGQQIEVSQPICLKF